VAGVPPEDDAPATRVAVDGPDVTGPRPLAEAIAARLPALGRPAAVVPAEGFYRAASLRFERGRTDPDARYTDWLDAGALTREVLAPLGPGGSGSYLPVPGALLQGVGLAFDLVLHLRMSAAARRRRTPREQAWELPAFDRYDAEVDPAGLADAVVLADHPERPALVLGGRFRARRPSSGR
jgi:hypothetical protein